MGRELFIGSEKLIFVAPVRIHDRFIECFESKTMEQSGNLKKKKKSLFVFEVRPALLFLRLRL